MFMFICRIPPSVTCFSFVILIYSKIYYCSCIDVDWMQVWFSPNVDMEGLLLDRSGNCVLVSAWVRMNPFMELILMRWQRPQLFNPNLNSISESIRSAQVIFQNIAQSRGVPCSGTFLVFDQCLILVILVFVFSTYANTSCTIFDHIDPVPGIQNVIYYTYVIPSLECKRRWRPMARRNIRHLPRVDSGCVGRWLRG